MARAGLCRRNGFQDQADVLIHARLAADMLGATKMDRPEDVDVNPVSGKVYAMLTDNTKRKSEATDAANPRGPTIRSGTSSRSRPTAAIMRRRGSRWEILVKCGNPAIGSSRRDL